MIRIRHILLIIFTLHLSGLFAQGTLLFEAKEWNFGTIRESDGHVSHIFTAENRGDKPIVLLDVVTSCGCTAPEFSRKPILPKTKTQIKVTFDPANRPGTFAKELAVYSSERQKIATLIVRGSVIERQKSIDELYPVDTGNGLRLSETLCAFSYLYQGRRMHSAIGYINSSGRTLTLELSSERSSGLLVAEYPRSIAPGQKGTIAISYDIPTEKPRYGTISDALRVVINGKVASTVLVAHGIGVDDPAQEEQTKAPTSTLSTNIVKFGSVKRSGATQKALFTLSNEGSAPLIIRAVELTKGLGCALRTNMRIPAGSSHTVEMTLAPSTFDYGIITGSMLLITNDPSRPMRKLRVTAIIEE